MAIHGKNFPSWNAAQKKEKDLETQLKDADQQLYIVENISPTALKPFGGHFKVDPQFFLDYVSMVIPSASTPARYKRSEDDTRTTEPLPWFRNSNIENHIPQLRSVESRMSHVHIQFVGPREFHPLDSSSFPVTLDDRPEPDLSQINVGRVAGGHNPIQLEKANLWPVAMTRHSAAAWFNGSGSNDWSKGSLSRQDSKYRAFSYRPLYERSTPDLNSLESILKKLFFVRRRTRKYEALVYDQVQLKVLANWQDSSSASRDPICVAIEEVLKQVQDIIHHNNDRITQTVDLITSVILVIEGKKSNTQNQRLTFLTILAAVALPLNTFVTIFGMQIDYGSDKPKLWIFFMLSSLVMATVLVAYLVVHLCP
ncbi:hypothetical protein K469DRAFT_694751 [Zopfia rhizophila CBS 207.26]|uniref:Cora-domain-containing protein n=1 Tax=Zopfia rhizophila CBS 207.26 TaxID=1314779 RepID=A0A6A6ERI1_9PEZI|nr:hypothetical protein K469DRAFT_694751 [Zopfia rhizophila CBS 207.26]